VTGASSGIGRACAIRFARLGYKVFAGVRNLADGEAVRGHSAGEIVPVLLDVTRPESIEGVLTTTGESPLAGLINSAGIGTSGPLELLPIDTLRRHLEVNVIGLVAVTKAFLPQLRRGRGRIVNIGSIAGRSALPGSGTYDATKFAVEAISDVLRMELHPWGISVSVIEPGAVATPIWEKCLKEADELRESVPTEQYALYRGLMEKVREETKKMARTAIDVSAVVRSVEHAMTARRPRTRYVVGWDAWFWLALNFLPDRWRDKLILSRIEVSGRAKP
jgi:short-subunit dehydrogenase